jgi:hypothetical protein
LFSDSVEVAELILERDRLEYFLETITSRSEEKVFEHYCRELCERSICPALVPQTGPTGGGDSKVDTENHPVSEAIATRWYVGNANTAATERFAFAFSAKKDWNDKVGLDVESIASTGRAYTCIFFVTNQAVADKKKARVQDALSKKYGVRLVILDRNWLVDKSLDPKNVDVVATKLGLNDLERRRRKTQGPNDHSRLQRLEQLEQYIADVKRYQDSAYQLIEDCIEAALIARSLGSSREEVESRFDRAARFAKDTRRQLFRIEYLRTWTRYWWFDDIASIREAFPRLTKQFLVDASAWDIEYLVNLWISAQGSRQADAVSLSGDFEEAGRQVVAALERIARIKGQPTHAAWATSLLLFMEMTTTQFDGKSLDPLLKRLRQTLKSVRNLPEYPVESLLNWLSAMIEICPPNSELAHLAEDMASVQSKRSSVASRADVFTQLANQYVKAGDPYSALQQLGKAQAELKRYNSIQHQAEIWQLCARAYANAGLLWAARSCILASAHVSFGEFIRDGRLPPNALPHVRQLIWFELQLGQVALALRWLALFDGLSATTITDQAERDRLIDDRRGIEVATAIAVLRTQADVFKSSPWIPPVLDNAGVFFASTTALVCFGYEEDVANEIGTSKSDVTKTMQLVRDHPIGDELPLQFEWRNSDRAKYGTKVLGVSIQLDVMALAPCLRFAEGFLGFLEALFATGLGRKLWGIRESIIVVINRGSADTLRYRVVEDECGESRMNVEVPDKSPMSAAGVHEWIELSLKLFGEIGHAQDLGTFKRLLVSGDAALDRASSLAHVPLTLENMLGDLYPASPTWPDAIRESDLRPYIRTTEYVESLPAAEPRAADKTKTRKDMIKHQEIAIPGLIYSPLWDKAKWSGMYFFTPPGEMPAMGPFFKDLDAAKKIFKGLRKRVGDYDLQNHLLITILTGISRKHPFHYRTAVCANVKSLMGRSDIAWMSGVRSNTMEPESDENLERFLSAYKEHGKYLFAPAHIGSGQWPDIDRSLGIVKSDLSVVPAWTVSPGSDLMLALRRNDAPFIPTDQPNAPVLEALAMIKGERKPPENAPFRWPVSE